MIPNFKKMMSDAGLPVDNDVAKQQWDQELAQQQITVENNSPFSPFWRTVEALITKPVVALLDWISKSLMPDMFIMTARREALITLHGPSRNVFVYDAIKAKGILKLTRVNTTGALTLNVGSLVESDSIGGVVYQLTTLNTAVFNDGEAVTQVTVEATATGQAYNLPAGSYYQLVVPMEGVTITNDPDWLMTPGSDEESTEAYRDRIRNVFGTAAKWHINTVYKSIISDFGIPIDNIEIVNGAPRGAGTADAYIYLNIGSVSTVLLNTINNHIRDDGHHGHGDDFMIYAMPSVASDITATYQLHPNSIDIKSDVDAFIRAAFRQNDVWQPTRTQHNSTFSISQLKTEMHNQFPELKTINFNIGDIDSGLWLPQLNSLVVLNG